MFEYRGRKAKTVMTTEQYLKQVIDLLKLQVKTKTIFSDKEIEEFREVKPVPLGVQMIEVLNRKYKHPKEIDVYDFEKNIALPMDYPNLKEVLDVLESVYLEENRNLDAKRVSLKKSFIKNDLEDFCGAYNHLEYLCKEFLVNREISIEVIENQLYIVEDAVALRILVNSDGKYQKIFEEPNMGFLAEEIETEHSKFILIEGDSNENLIALLTSFLMRLGKEVFVLKMPLCYQGEGIQMADTVSISVENIQKEGNITYVYPIKIVSEKDGEADNIPYLIEYINDHYNDGGHINVLGQGYQVDLLSVNPLINKKMTRLSQYFYDKREYNLAFARYGDYLEYISKIYKEDCKKLLYKKPTKKFSIVIPVRDSIRTLKHTIKTCLEQTYEGDYEIVISDNSVKNTEVYEFCKELDNPRIKYLKTPRNLCLTKSFEFAHLHASGEYILALGADDGVLPWALSTLADVTKEFPEELIIEWTRGFYAWPGFNGGQQHQLTITGLDFKDELSVCYISFESYLMSILESPQSMYALPLLYINSCFKRELLHKMYEVTGELFDGRNQDIATGIVMMAINDRILNISRPLTIAGMSSGSVGATCNKAENVQLKMKVTKDNNVGMHVSNYYEHMVPFLGSDVSGMYLAMVRAVSKGLISYRVLNKQIDWGKAFIHMLDSRSVNYISYYEDMYKARYAAGTHGEKFLKWYDEQILPQRMKLCVIDEEALAKSRTERLYKTGKGANGTMTLDASEYDVENIYDAVKVFEKIYNE